jgi:hypothetical protein
LQGPGPVSVPWVVASGGHKERACGKS